MKTLKPTIKTLGNRLSGSTGTTRIRGKTGQVIRERILRRDGYICQSCLPRITRADVVDHIVPLYLGGAESDINRQSLCHECHDKKTEGEAKSRH